MTRSFDLALIGRGAIGPITPAIRLWLPWDAAFQRPGEVRPALPPHRPGSHRAR